MTFTLGPKAISAGYGLAAFDQIGSTNAEAMSRARDGERGATWFVTTEQTAGRGRRQRAWIAPRGNLASSVLEVMDVSPAVAATMGFAFGLAHESALQRVSVEAKLRLAGLDQLQYLLKWPNDILVRGQKLCGLLVEAEAMTDGGLAVVAGIGTNIIAAPEGTPTPATSLAALGVHVGAEELFAALSDAFPGFSDSARAGPDPGCFTIEVQAPSGATMLIRTEEEDRITVGFDLYHCHFGGFAESVDDIDFSNAIEFIRNIMAGRTRIAVWTREGVLACSVSFDIAAGPPTLPGVYDCELAVKGWFPDQKERRQS
jgi:BirA family biotin operon repressor/biotin-[acetyl-CoA-carboxylase] ligase